MTIPAQMTTESKYAVCRVVLLAAMFTLACAITYVLERLGK